MKKLFVLLFIFISLISCAQRKASTYYSVPTVVEESEYVQEYQDVLDYATDNSITHPSSQIKTLQNELMFKMVRSGIYDTLKLSKKRNFINVLGDEFLIKDFAWINWLDPDLTNATEVGSVSLLPYYGVTGATNSIVKSGQTFHVNDTATLYNNFNLGAYYINGIKGGEAVSSAAIGFSTGYSTTTDQQYFIGLSDFTSIARMNTTISDGGNSGRLLNLVFDDVSDYPFLFTGRRETGVTRSFINQFEGNNTRTNSTIAVVSRPAEFGFFGTLRKEYSSVSDTTTLVDEDIVNPLRDTVAAVFYGYKLSTTLLDSLNQFLTAYKNQVEALNNNINPFASLYFPDETQQNYVPALPRIPAKFNDGITGGFPRAGETSTIWYVDSAKYTGLGGFFAAMDSATNDGTKSIIMFRTSGTFEDPNGDGTFYGSYLVNQRDLSVMGQTAPSPGIRFHDMEFNLRGNNQIWQHIRFGAGDDTLDGVGRLDPINSAGWTQYGERDGLKIKSDSIIIANSTICFGTDENLQTTGSNLIIYQNLTSKPLANVGHQKGYHPKGFLFLKQDSAGGENLFVSRNVFSATVDRNPQYGGQVTSMTQENYTWNAKNGWAGVYQSVKGRWTGDTLNGGFIVGTVVNNIYEQVTKAPIRVYEKGFDSTGAVWINGNILDGNPFYPNNPNQTVIATSQIDTTPDVSFVPDSVLKPYLLEIVGSFPRHRDTVEKEIISEIKLGALIPPPDNFRPYDSIIQLDVNYRQLTLPSNPFTVDSTGYTRVEKWLDSLHWIITYPDSIPYQPLPAHPAHGTFLYELENEFLEPEYKVIKKETAWRETV